MMVLWTTSEKSSTQNENILFRKNQMNDKKDLKKKIWLAKLKNIYPNTHVYTYIVKDYS